MPQGAPVRIGLVVAYLEVVRTRHSIHPRSNLHRLLEGVPDAGFFFDPDRLPAAGATLLGHLLRTPTPYLTDLLAVIGLASRVTAGG